MIGYIKDAIQSGLYQDFWGEDSLLVDGFHECYGEQLTCEGFCAYPSSTDDNVVYVDIGGDSVHRFKITIEGYNYDKYLRLHNEGAAGRGKSN